MQTALSTFIQKNQLLEYYILITDWAEQVLS